MPIDGTSSDKNDSLIDMVFERNEDLKKSRLTSVGRRSQLLLTKKSSSILTLDLQHTDVLY